MTPKIVVVGSMNMDLVVFADRHPAIGETILGNSFHMYPGGKGANQAISAARLGANVSLVGCLGWDSYGSDLLQNLKRNNIDTTYIRKIKGTSTGTALITVSNDGGNSIIVVPGANYAVNPMDVDAAGSQFVPGNILLVQMEVPMEVVTYAIQKARQQEMQVILNPAPARLLPESVYQQVDYLVPNRSELNLLAGGSRFDTLTVEAGVEKLRTLGLKKILVTLGDHGVRFISPTRDENFPAYRVPVVDTTAAGDAFIGGFSAGLAEGLSEEEAIQLGTAAGALAVTKAGAQASLPSRLEVDQFRKSN